MLTLVMASELCLRRTRENWTEPSRTPECVPLVFLYRPRTGNIVSLAVSVLIQDFEHIKLASEFSAQEKFHKEKYFFGISDLEMESATSKTPKS